MQNGKKAFFCTYSWGCDFDLLAQTYIAEMYRKGIGIKQNYEKAIESYQKLIDEKKVVSALNLADLYLVKIEQAEKDVSLSELIKQAEKADSKFMQFFGVETEPMKQLGAIYLTGSYPENRHKFKHEAETKADKEKARYWLEKYVALTNDNEVAYWLANGLEDVKWMKKAADLGNKYALFEMAKAHYKGKKAIQDTEQAKQYATRACEEGNEKGCLLYKDALKFPDYSELIKAKIAPIEKRYYGGNWE